jgi:tetratricopeptide (TPR) repeat protein
MKTRVLPTRRLLLAGAALLAVVVAGVLLLRRPGPRPSPAIVAEGEEASVAGSESCRGCHEVFFQKWSTSFHGLAMRPHTGQFARDRLTPQARPLAIGGKTYQAFVGTESDHVVEKGPDGSREYPIVQMLGGKNVCYFLTPLERGHLQVLPVAYDLNRGEWFSTAGSAVRHFEGVRNEELDWTDRAYTFNTSCFSCHVSQLATNYEPETDSYRTVWAEPGVSCETCHGPAGAHVKAFEALRPGQKPPDDMRIVSVKSLTKEQRNDLCASCHAKASPLWSSFKPGDRFFDHFDLTTLENPDFYPDGRDLGENYTLTSWRMSPCARSGQLDCVHCHTSSGRYRFKDRPNDACLPCHAERVRNAREHSWHSGGGPGGRCTDCHMPLTEFARMRRTDHSMRPPAPAATIAFGSPNACNLCHKGRNAGWANRAVRVRYTGDYQNRILREGRLVAAARKGDWSQLGDILAYLAEADRDEIVTTSLVRLLVSCADPCKWPVLRSLAGDASPLVRAAAVEALERDPDGREVLLRATRDTSRLVRVRAAAALAPLDPGQVPGSERPGLETAYAELQRSLLARPDDFASHYNLGNLFLERGDPGAAAERYRRALALRPDHLASLVNLSMAEARLGRMAEAESALRRALEVDPRCVAAHFNLGLLLAETGRKSEGESELRHALREDPHHTASAYNLAVLLGESKPGEAARLAARAAAADPGEARYAWTQAFYLQKAGDAQGAERVLRRLVDQHPGYRDGWALLGALLEAAGRGAEAQDIYRRAASSFSLSPGDRAAFEARARAGSAELSPPGR